MVSNASTFILNRKDALSITNQRIRYIISYVIECHWLLLSDNVTYSQTWVQQNTTFHFEDYMKFKFLDDYLIPNKHLLNDVISELEEINFAPETQKRYIDTDGKQKPDKIDICINKLGLQKVWNDNDENVYLAIECKRIRQLSDTNDYIVDIEKFCNRNYTHLRLPFEGQIAFIENSKLTHVDVKNGINDRLNISSTITTCSLLSSIKLHSKIQCSYISRHKKNFIPKERFSIYHLMFDYSGVVLK
jgi:hypothetical protein